MILQRTLFILCALLVFGPVAVAAGPSLETKVGQLFMIGFPQRKPDAKLKKLIEDIRPGGFILFGRNLGAIEEIKSFNASLRRDSLRVSGVPPLLAVDQEGGAVVRVPVFPSIPSAYSVGKTENGEFASILGEEMGKVLHWTGFNMNLAPVLDLSDPARPSFIGARSYGPDPVLAGKMGRSFAQGLLNEHVLPTAKHFPGLGAISADPHVSQARNTASTSEIKERDLKAFSAYFELGHNSALMVSQLSYPSLDESGVPAAFSRKILHDLARTSLGYDGLIITDDLQMKGSSLVYSPEEAALQSLRAGADIVMITWSAEQQRKAFRRVLAAVRSGEWSEDEVDRRFERIRRVKGFIDGKGPKVTDIASGPGGFPLAPRLEKLDLKILDKNIDRLPAALPMSVASKPDCIVSPQKRFLDSYKQASRRKNSYFRLAPAASAKEFREKLSVCPRIVFAVSGKRTGLLLETLPPSLREKTIVVNLGMPSLVDADMKFAARIEIGYPHFHAGFRMAQIMENRRPEN